MRYAITLSYDGGRFCGWQVQNDTPTVQGVLQLALSTLLRTGVEVTGAGRTDTAVNACGYVAHFDFDGEVPADPSQLACKLNAILPPEITVHSIVPATPDFHARFDASRREYTYFLHRKKDPFVEAFSYRCGYPALDFEAMNRACPHLIGTHDFSCFEKTGGNSKTSICTVYEAFWAPYTPSYLMVMGRMPDTPGQEYWYFRISADRFLRNMVRAVVGTMIEIGRGKHDPGWIPELLGSGTRGDAGESVPGHALFLSKVLY